MVTAVLVLNADLGPLHRVSVRGYDHLQPWLVRRRATGDDTPHGYGEDAFDEDRGPDDDPDDENDV